MSPVNSPENPSDVDATAVADQAPKKRRRRVVRDVVTPDAPTTPASEPQAEPVPPVVEPEPVTPPEAAAPVEAPPTQDGPTQDAPAAPRARRSRRVTRTVVLDDAPPAATPEPVVPAEPVQDELTQDEPVQDEPVQDEPTSAQDDDAAAAEATAAQDAEEPEASGVAESVDEEAEERAPRRRRSGRRGGRSSRAAQDAEPSDAAAPAEAAADVTVTDAAGDAPGSVAALDVLAELGPVRPTEEPPSRARLATTALLFQAPDPAARPRRRRSQATAGTPAEISEAARVEEAPDADVTPEEPQEAAPAADEGAGRARRRRGRGRRASTDVDEAVAEDAVPAEGSADTDEDDVEPVDLTESADDADTDADGDDEVGEDGTSPRRRRRRGGRGRRGRAGEDGADDSEQDETEPETPAEPVDDGGDEEAGGSSRRRRRRRRGARGEVAEEPRRRSGGDEVTALRGSTRLEAKRQRRREGRDAGRRRQIITEAEFLARREAVERSMVVREVDARTQIAVLEDGVLVEHYVSNQAQASMVGNVYLGRVQNVLPSMEAAFVDVGKGRNAVLYAGEVNWDAAGLEGQPRRIEQALKSGDAVLVQVTKDPIGHKGARLTSQITLAGRYLVYVPGGGMTGISRKLPDTERSRLKKILRDLVPDSAGVIVRTAAEGASEEELRADVARLQGQWEAIEKKRKTANAPALLQGEPDMAIRVVRDIFNDDFSSLVVQGDDAWSTISTYVGDLAPDLAARVEKWTGTQDVFTVHRVDEQLAKGMDRKVWLPSGGSLVIDRTEAMTVVDVNTGKFTGAGGTLEETVTRNNLEAAEEIVRQLRLRDIGGIIVIDFIDMVLESNRDLVLRRLVECLGRDRTKHQVAEVTSLGLVQMTRKRVGQGLVEAFSETCEHCHGRGFIVHTDPVGRSGRPDAGGQPPAEPAESKRSRRKRAAAEQSGTAATQPAAVPVLPEAREAVKATLATIAAAAAHAHEHDGSAPDGAEPAEPEDGRTTLVVDVVPPTGGSAATLDVVAELSAAGVEAGPGAATALPTDAQLQLHAVAPEVFEDADEPQEQAATTYDGDADGRVADDEV
ncbi:Rne/Rng family ribonuclease [Cellulomonas wangsupingiae]|uniref:Rne/Rng family ribonuclease n=1 Tax=Cellulomonas wangsupingiae TaxID=2968085 RepID=A0ABY5K087_9CELL|nr:Rne/Rng family ribonuclease [Cellulomonas wangsupingiae]MCC2335603.1 Rne/Rng family ribonuclease [Cellulomonas wangsupingiae]UUI63842.1 Rne/Rng family ribonuclease [Cellulomonas wangsupingiae]